MTESGSPEARAQDRGPAVPTHPRFANRRWATTLGLLALVIVLFTLRYVLRPSAGSPRPLATGDRVILDGGGAEAVLLADAHDPAAWEAVLDATIRRDHPGLEALVRDHKAFWVASGTPAQVLEVSEVARRVRILDGPRTVAEGWVPAEAIRPDP